MTREDNVFVGLDIGLPEETSPLMDISESFEKNGYVCNIIEKKSPDMVDTLMDYDQDAIINPDNMPNNRLDNVIGNPSETRTDITDFMHELPDLDKANSGSTNPFEANQIDEFSSDNEQELPSLLRKTLMTPGRAKNMAARCRTNHKKPDIHRNLQMIETSKEDDTQMLHRESNRRSRTQPKTEYSLELAHEEEKAQL